MGAGLPSRCAVIYLMYRNQAMVYYQRRYDTPGGAAAAAAVVLQQHKKSTRYSEDCGGYSSCQEQ